MRSWKRQPICIKKIILKPLMTIQEKTEIDQDIRLTVKITKSFLT